MTNINRVIQNRISDGFGQALLGAVYYPLHADTKNRVWFEGMQVKLPDITTFMDMTDRR